MNTAQKVTTKLIKLGDENDPKVIKITSKKYLPTMMLHDFLKTQRKFYADLPQYKTIEENGLYTCDITVKRLIMVKSGEKHLTTSRISTTKLSAKQFAAEDMLAMLKKELHYKNSTHILPATTRRPAAGSTEPLKKRSRQAESKRMLQCLNGNWELHVPESKNPNSSNVF